MPPHATPYSATEHSPRQANETPGTFASPEGHSVGLLLMQISWTPLSPPVHRSKARAAVHCPLEASVGSRLAGQLQDGGAFSGSGGHGFGVPSPHVDSELQATRSVARAAAEAPAIALPTRPHDLPMPVESASRTPSVQRDSGLFPRSPGGHNVPLMITMSVRRLLFRGRGVFRSREDRAATAFPESPSPRATPAARASPGRGRGSWRRATR